MATRVLAVFGVTGAEYIPMLAEALPQWEVKGWTQSDPPHMRDALIAACEAAVISADFLLAEGNFGALLSGDRLKVILQPWVGTDWVDVNMLPKGIKICNAGGHAVPMAEYVLGTMLEHTLELRIMDGDMRAGRWFRSGRNNAAGARHHDLRGKTLSIIGYGEIGTAIAQRAAAFDMRLIALARSLRPHPPAPLDFIGVQADLHDVLAQSDYIALCCDLNAETMGMIDAAAFGVMKPEAYIINVARGEVIEEAPFYDALKHKRIAGAAIDTWYRYPQNIIDPETDPDRGGIFCGSQYDFYALDNVLCTPHCAAHTFGADKGRYESIAESLQAYSAGKDVKRHVLTGTGKASFEMPLAGHGTINKKET